MSQSIPTPISLRDQRSDGFLETADRPTIWLIGICFIVAFWFGLAFLITGISGLLFVALLAAVAATCLSLRPILRGSR